MRWAVVVASAGVLCGCASRPSPPPPPRVVLHRPHRPAATATASTAHTPPASTPVKLDPPSPPPEGPGANVPLEGFRPMRSQPKPGA